MRIVLGNLLSTKQAKCQNGPQNWRNVKTSHGPVWMIQSLWIFISMFFSYHIKANNYLVAFLIYQNICLFLDILGFHNFILLVISFPDLKQFWCMVPHLKKLCFFNFKCCGKRWRLSKSENCTNLFSQEKVKISLRKIKHLVIKAS